MANSKISAMTLATSVDGTETTTILQGGANKRTLLSTVKTWVDSELQARSTTPTLSFKDTDCSDTDVNASIVAAATDTGSGSEDIDVTFNQQVAGTLTAFLVSDADGSLTLGQSGQAIVLNGPVGDVTLKDATPILTFKDSSCSDSDANVTIEAAATTTTSAHEDVDLTFSQQVDGTLTPFLVADADGLLTLGQTGQGVAIGVLLAGLRVTPTTGTATPAAADTGTVYSNEGDANGAGVTLPTAAAGLQFTAIVQAAQTFTITAASGDTIRVAASATPAAGNISANTVGNAVTLLAINATEWVATSVIGTWTVSE